ncbi:MerR family transcriptional regulator [Neobacillus sp. D3-1R]|uniref:MerR family transcriptional regulator n=1 Tax=Neobacillus sp. D3-1R TaxID=3445778 RepID=UPI003F9F0734
MTDISKRTIDYYTQLGLLNPMRTDSNYRLYSEDSLQTLKLVDHYKKMNMPLEEIKNLIVLLNSKTTAVDEMIMKKHVEQISEYMHHLEMEIKELRPILENLDGKQKELILKRLSNQGSALAQSLLYLIS